MVSTNLSDADSRQVLVNVGNRYVLFGSESSLPASRAFGPKDVEERLPRVPDQREISEERLIRSLRLSGAEIMPAPPDTMADLTFTDHSGQKVLVEIKVRDRDAGTGDFERFHQLFKDTPPGFRQEVWNFNLERLHLQMFVLEEGRLIGATSLRPLDVWEFNLDGSTFSRARVQARVLDWESRIIRLYDEVARWAKHAGFRTERTRNVLMSEELMQQFAVPDRELPVLDVLREDQTAASFVPVALWIIGANGRINLVTHVGTHILVDNAKALEKPEWAVVSSEDRRKSSPFDEAAFAELVRTS